MVVNIISIPGVLSPEMVEKFRLTIEKALKKTLDQQTADMAQTMKKVKEGFDKQKHTDQVKKQDDQAGGKDKTEVEGYKMEEMNSEDKPAELPSSGAQWYMMLFVLALLILVGIGMRRRSGRTKIE
jgi:cobaltochelatase CobN